MQAASKNTHERELPSTEDDSQLQLPDETWVDDIAELVKIAAALNIDTDKGSRDPGTSTR